MIQSGFLSEEDRKALTALTRNGSSPSRERLDAFGQRVELSASRKCVFAQ
jgi:hypothetical protein